MRNHILSVALIGYCFALVAAPARAQQRLSVFAHDFNIPPSNVGVQGPNDPQVKGSGTVFFSALAGSLIVGTIGAAKAFAETFMSDQGGSDPLISPWLGAGAALGGLAGASLRDRKLAFLPTVLGAAVGMAPLVLLERNQRELRGPAPYLLLVLPAFGAWFGNELGQDSR